MTLPTPTHRGHLRRQPDGTIGGELIEQCTGWPLRLVATRDPDGGYTLEAWLGPVPDAFKIPGLDEDLGEPAPQRVPRTPSAPYAELDGRGQVVVRDVGRTRRGR